jgi:hypothetical protein
MKITMSIKKVLIVLLILVSKFSFAQTYSEILGRPTDTSITISIMFNQSYEVYWEYGTNPGVYTTASNTFTTIDSLPLEVDFLNLTTNTKYYYRTRYRLANTNGAFGAGVEHSFYTHRPPGSTFSFAVEADPHLDTNTIPASLTLSMQNMLAKKVDFLVDLGDNFLSEKYVLLPGQQNPIAHYQDTILYRTKLFRPYFGTLCHSAPLFLTIGNHEGELGWKITGTDSSMPVVATNLRKQYYPNPYPNSFYTGNDSAEQYVGLREDYYAWNWGDALFVVIDPYWFTKPAQHGGWGWTLGLDQYNWFKKTITTSKAKFKFVFSHQLVGGNGTDARGGSEFAGLFEQGGYNLDGTYGFDTYRAGWGKPIHQLMNENNGVIYFHGHDHFFGKQDKDNVVYQEVPQPPAKNIISINGTDPAYGYTNGILMSNRGYVFVTVSPDSVKVDYIKTYLPSEVNASRKNGDIAYTYTIKPSVITGINEIFQKDFVKVFPSPARDQINVQFTENTLKYNIKLINIDGKTLIETKSKSIDVGRLKSGIYFVTVDTDQYHIIRKVVVGK